MASAGIRTQKTVKGFRQTMEIQKDQGTGQEDFPSCTLNAVPAFLLREATAMTLLWTPFFSGI